MAEHPVISPIIRPALLAVVAFAVFGVALVSGLIDIPMPGVGIRFGITVTTVMARVPDSMVELFGLMFSVYALGKTAERGTKAYTDAKASAPGGGEPQEA